MTLLSLCGGQEDHCLDPFARNPAWGACLTDILQVLYLESATALMLGQSFPWASPGKNGAGGVTRGSLTCPIQNSSHAQTLLLGTPDWPGWDFLEWPCSLSSCSTLSSCSAFTGIRSASRSEGLSANSGSLLYPSWPFVSNEYLAHLIPPWH